MVNHLESKRLSKDQARALPMPAGLLVNTETRMSPGYYLTYGLTSALRFESLIPYKDTLFGETTKYGELITWKDIEALPLSPDIINQYKIIWDGLVKDFTIDSELSKPIGPEFNIFRGNRITLFNAALQKIMGRQYFDLDNPIVKIILKSVDESRLVAWRNQRVELRTKEPTDIYQQAMASTLNEHGLLTQVQDRSFLMMAILGRRKAGGGGATEIVGLSDIANVRVEELQIIVALSKAALTAINEVDKNGRIDFGLVKDDLDKALVDHVPDYPDIEDALIRQYLGQELYERYVTIAGQKQSVN